MDDQHAVVALKAYKGCCSLRVLTNTNYRDGTRFPKNIFCRTLTCLIFGTDIISIHAKQVISLSYCRKFDDMDGGCSHIKLR